MAKDSSFDIVSELDLQEVDNGINQAFKEVVNRYDLKDSKTTIEMDRDESVIRVESENDYTLGAAIDVLKAKLVKRKVSLKALDMGKIEPSSGGRAKQEIALRQGIESDKGKEIAKFIKELKIKADSRIEGDRVRVSSKSRDILQEVIGEVKAADFDLPLQFINYR